MSGCAVGTSHFMMALAIWRESRGEVVEAQIAVGHAIMNRVERPGWWGKNIPEVIGKKWQFSSLTDPKDPQLIKWPLYTDPSWVLAWVTASEILAGVVPNPVPGADSYYDDSIAPPNWASGASFVKKIGKLNFYNVDHDYEKQIIA